MQVLQMTLLYWDGLDYCQQGSYELISSLLHHVFPTAQYKILVSLSLWLTDISF